MPTMSDDQRSPFCARSRTSCRTTGASEYSTPRPSAYVSSFSATVSVNWLPRRSNASRKAFGLSMVVPSRVIVELISAPPSFSRHPPIASKCSSENDGGAEINSTITLDGTTIDSPKAFREALLRRGNQFTDTVAEKLLTYALGRGVEYSDAPVVRQLVRDLAQNGDRWSSLIVGIAKSTPFQMRRVPGTVELTPTAAPRQ